MIFDNFIINEEVKKKLFSFYLNKHLPNAFIFHGNDGIGKEAMALEFFALLNCKNHSKNEVCGNCPSCKKTRILQHELLNIITPLPRGKSSNKNNSPLDCLTEKERQSLTSQLSMKSQDPYFKIRIEKANTIIINSIKDIKKNINLSIPDKCIKLHLIFEAEKLCFPKQEAANSLLKILEEPKKNNLFILITSDINKIIDTILSRCTHIYFPEIGLHQIKNKLMEKNVPEVKAKIISKISFGNMREAFSMVDSFESDIKLLEKLLLSIIHNNLSNWNSLFNYNDKYSLRKILNLFTITFRDISMLRVNSEICFSNFREYYEQLQKEYPSANFSECINIINNADNYILRNGNVKLIIISLFIEIENILKNRNLNSFNLSHWIN